MKVLIAPNAFKDSLSAVAAAAAIERGLSRSHLHCTCRLFPVGDGGDGTAELLVRHFNGRRVQVTVRGPMGQPVNAHIGLIREGRTAVIEMAEASGIHLLASDQRDPLRASSVGTGELIHAALASGVRKVILCLGGSATVDGGAGLLHALGLQLRDAVGNALPARPDKFTQAVSLDTSGIDNRLRSCEFTLLCDVNNPILGSRGAAPVFGPQKGATAQAVRELEVALAHWCRLLHAHTGIDVSAVERGGAAGGAAAGLMAVLQAQAEIGIEYFLEVTEFDTALEGAELVITGEGSIDDQTLQWKAPYGVAKHARAHGLPVVALAGQVPLEAGDELRELFNVMLSIGHQPETIAEARSHTEQNLVRAARELGNALSLVGPN